MPYMFEDIPQWPEGPPPGGWVAPRRFDIPRGAGGRGGARLPVYMERGLRNILSSPWLDELQLRDALQGIGYRIVGVMNTGARTDPYSKQNIEEQQWQIQTPGGEIRYFTVSFEEPVADSDAPEIIRITPFEETPFAQAGMATAMASRGPVGIRDEDIPEMERRRKAQAFAPSRVPFGPRWSRGEVEAAQQRLASEGVTSPYWQIPPGRAEYFREMGVNEPWDIRRQAMQFGAGTKYSGKDWIQLPDWQKKYLQEYTEGLMEQPFEPVRELESRPLPRPQWRVPRIR